MWVTDDKAVIVSDVWCIAKNRPIKICKIGREIQDRGDIGIPMADSCWSLAETNRIP